jgi:predicted RNA-binding protein with PIN domain
MKLDGDSLQKRRDDLINKLQQFLEINPGNITIVFDGANNISEHKSIEKKGNIKIIFSANNQSADDVIIELIKNRKVKAKNMVLVTSDRKLQDYAYTNRIKVIKSIDFNEYFE